MKYKASVSRRQVLRDIGLGAMAGAAMPFMPLLEGEARAAGGPIRRLVCVVYGNGTCQPKDAYFPKGAGFDLSTSVILGQLKELQSKIVVIDGLEHTLFRNSGAGGTVGLSHPRARAQVLTGMGVGDGKGLGGISVDQFVANAIDAQAKSAGLRAPPFKSIDSAVNVAETPCIQATGRGQNITPTQEPGVQFERLFSGVAVPTAADPKASEQAFQRRRMERETVFDFVGRRLQAIGNLVGTDGKLKVESHLDHLSSLRTRLAQLGAPIAGCPSGPLTPLGESAMEKTMDGHAQVIARAFACDLSRVAVLSVVDTPGSVAGPGVKANEHYIAHYAAQGKENYPNYHVTLDTWRMGLIKGLLKHLDGIREDTGTLLDNSLVLVTSDMGAGNHNNSRVPAFIAGSGGGVLKTGRTLKVSKVPFNNVHVSLCGLMGFPVDKFGAPSVCTGAVPGLA